MKFFNFYRMYRRFGCDPLVALRRAIKAVQHHAQPSGARQWM